MTAAILARLTPDQQQHLANVDAWNEWATEVNQRAIEQGIVDAATVEADHVRCEAARRDLLARWTV